MAGNQAVGSEQSSSDDAAAPRHLSDTELYLLALASAVVTANAYYIHPVIARVASDFGVSAAMIGAVPALNQIALALGIFLLLPLGDWISNRRLASIFVAGQFLSVTLMAFSENFYLFVCGSTVLGFFTITPYLLPAYVSKRVPPERLGRATAVLTTGVIGGILVARVGAGFIGEHIGWRTVYFIAAGLMALVSFVLPLLMEEGKREKGSAPTQKYIALLASIGPIVRKYPEIILSGTIQALGFGVFLALWLGLGLYLPSDEMGYGVDTVGYLAGIAIFNLVFTPLLGAWADRTGARRARVMVTMSQLVCTIALLFLGHSLWLLIVPLVLMNVLGPTIDIAGRMTFLSEAPEIRTRLMTVYIVCMFTGGGMASWAGTAAYDWGGWTGTVCLTIGLSALAFALAVWALRWDRRPANR